MQTLKIKYLNYLLITLMIIFPKVVAGYEVKSIGSLDKGNCWITLAGDEPTKLVSFSDGRIFELNQSDVLKSIEKELAKKKIAKTHTGDRKEVFIHCGSYGSSLVIHFYGPEGELCYWGKIGKNNKITESYFLGLQKGGKEACYGYYPGSIIISFKKDGAEEDKNNYLRELKNGEFKEVVKDAKIITTNLLKVSLREDFFYHEEEFIEGLENFSLSQDIISYIELNYFYKQVGEFYFLENYSH